MVLILELFNKYAQSLRKGCKAKVTSLAGRYKRQYFTNCANLASNSLLFPLRLFERACIPSL